VPGPLGGVGLPPVACWVASASALAPVWTGAAMVVDPVDRYLAPDVNA